MPVYNGQRYIKETIDSVLNQTYENFEYIIVDDGSTDGTKDIIKSFSDIRIRMIEINHGGIVKALNTGIENALGEYVVRIDADDVCMENRFKVLFDYMNKNTDVVICGSWATKIDEQGKPLGALSYPPISHKEIKKYAKIHNPFIHPSVILRKDAILKAGGYKNFKHTEDYELWTRILSIGKGYNISEPLIKYRIHLNQITRKSNVYMKITGILVRILAVFRLSF